MTCGLFLLYYCYMKKLVKQFFILAIMLLISLPTSALILQGNAEFNAEIAREETFNNIVYTLDPEEFKEHWSDPNHVINYNTLKNGQNRIANRELSLFSDGTYGVRYLSDPYHNYYYDPEGVLFKIDVLNKPFNVYPHRSIAYNRYGSFKNATFVISKTEQYLYDVNKKLLGHWVGNACYDSKGNVLMLRKNAE